MTEWANGAKLSAAPAWIGLALSAALGAGCNAYIDNQPARPDSSDLDYGPPPEPGSSECSDVARGAHVVLQRYCSRCHGGGPTAVPAMPDALDTEDLISRGLIVPGDADGSRMLQRVQSGQMPPVTVGIRPDAADMVAVRHWIDCGAPSIADLPAEPPIDRPFISVDDVFTVIEEDLEARPRSAVRTRYRYVLLVHEWNRGASDQHIQRLREAVSFTINSLSRSVTVARPTPIDDEQVIFRLDLNEYGWSAADWEALVRDYPYAIAYDEDSVEYASDETARRFVVTQTRTEVPMVYADWLVGTASHGQRYYDLLRMPATLGGLRTSLGLSPRSDPARDRLDRAAFAESGVSISNRIIERTPISDGRVFWTSFDFRTSTGTRNVFSHPMDFTHDGGETIFTLPNGLQAYYLEDAVGTRIVKAPTEVVSDDRMPDRAVVVGLSCMGCHDRQGIIPRIDEVRPHVQAAAIDPVERQEILRTYIEPEAMSELMRQDGERFRAARAAAGLDGDTREPVVEIALHYQEELDLAGLASLLFLEPEQLRAVLRADPSAFARTIAGLTRDGFYAPRDEVVAELPAILCAMELGRPVCSETTESSPCGCVRVIPLPEEPAAP